MFIGMEVKNGKSKSLITLALAILPLSSFAYVRVGQTPVYAKRAQVEVRWTQAEVDQSVETTVEVFDASTKASTMGAPLSCDKLKVLRMRSKDAPANAEQADAAVLLVPGILEGAGAFHHIGRQLVYMAKRFDHKNIEVWGMDRRANCLEDLAGLQVAGRPGKSLAQVEDQLIGYYYKGALLDGKRFAGYLKPSQTRYLSEFGMAQATHDMRDIIQHFMPTPGVSKRKAFVGGHSLGGIHASTFLAWDFDGNPSTTDDAGYNMVAGAIGLETIITSLSETPRFLGKLAPMASHFIAGTYPATLAALKSGVLPAQTFIPGLIGPEVLALPTALGLFARDFPGQESHALQKIGALSPELKGFANLLSARNVGNLIFPPHFSDYRFTTTALVGMAFNKHNTPLGFLDVGLGFLTGGPVVKRTLVPNIVRQIPLLGDVVGAGVGLSESWCPADAGVLGMRGTGPLYGWADRDEIGSQPTDSLMDMTGKVTFTTLQSNPSKMRDFAAALAAPLDLTEWYYPTRYFIDAYGLADNSTAIKHGLNVFYPDAPRSAVSTLVINGDKGLITSGSLGSIAQPQPNLIVAKGFAHLDPLFETVESTSQVDYVMRPILDFLFKNAK